MISAAMRRACVEARTYARLAAGRLAARRGYVAGAAPQVRPVTPVEKILLDTIRVSAYGYFILTRR